MKRTLRGAAVAAAPFILASTTQAQNSNDYTAPRNATVDARGARSIEVEAGAGELRVEGKPGLTSVQVTGTARASSQQLLSQVKLIAERRGDVVFVRADIPEESWQSNWNGSMSLDLVIDVPQGLDATVGDGSGDAKIINVGALDASDGSGDFTVEGAAGTVHVTDGSGDLTIENVHGDVFVNDGSGDIKVRSVTGSFTVESDGSGGIYASEIRGSVVVKNDGSGEIDANGVGQNLTVENKGSGEITYSNVSGRVEIPERHHGRSRRGDR